MRWLTALALCRSETVVCRSTHFMTGDMKRLQLPAPVMEIVRLVNLRHLRTIPIKDRSLSFIEQFIDRHIYDWRYGKASTACPRCRNCPFG